MSKATCAQKAIAFFESPEYYVPVQSFIDDKCIVFNEIEENPHALNDMHLEYRKLVEGVIDEFLKDIGETPENFFKSLDEERGRSVQAARIVEHMFAVDDFLSFKSMMQKRNCELNLEVLAMLETKKAETEAVSAATPASAPEVKLSGEADKEMAEALRLSKQEADAFAKQVSQEEAELQLALQLSLDDHEFMKQKEQRLLEMEAAELEYALAVSRAMQEDKQRAIDEEKNACVATPAPNGGGPSNAPVPPVVSSEPKATASETSKPTVVLEETKQSAAQNAEASAKEELRVRERLQTLKLERLQKESSKPGSSKGSLPPLKVSAGSLPRSSSITTEITKTCASQESTIPIPTQVLKAANEGSSVSEEEIQRRREAMRRQRDLLLQKRNQERETELNNFKASKKGTTDKSVRTSEKMIAQNKPSQGQEQMRNVLLQRVRADLLSSVENDKSDSLLASAVRARGGSQC